MKTFQEIFKLLFKVYKRYPIVISLILLTIIFNKMGMINPLTNDYKLYGFLFEFFNSACVQSFISSLNRLTPVERFWFWVCTLLWIDILYSYLHDIITNKNFHPVVEKLLLILLNSFCWLILCTMYIIITIARR
jgi:hypothetical protein